jgi:hypothetical protein
MFFDINLRNHSDFQFKLTELDWMILEGLEEVLGVS